MLDKEEVKKLLCEGQTPYNISKILHVSALEVRAFRDSLVKEGKKKDSDKECFAYLYRNMTLECYDYASYSEYRSSEEWVSIKKYLKGLNPKECCLCEASYDVFHHVNYLESTLFPSYPLSSDFKYNFIPVCHDCHTNLEMTSNYSKNSVKEANRKLKNYLLKKIKFNLYTFSFDKSDTISAPKYKHLCRVLRKLDINPLKTNTGWCTFLINYFINQGMRSPEIKEIVGCNGNELQGGWKYHYAMWSRERDRFERDFYKVNSDFYLDSA